MGSKTARKSASAAPAPRPPNSCDNRITPTEQATARTIATRWVIAGNVIADGRSSRPISHHRPCSRIIGGTDALPHIERLAAAIEAQPHARIPGSRRIALRQAAAAKGIDLPEALLSRIE
ncbi:hypothetical protein E3U26_19100 (plasmid) [Paracoccus ferrooxidans]|nr:hypothetical protein E3U26_19100 [Paracoccus ferrooxidans]